jgi:hypothetical protein
MIAIFIKEVRENLKWAGVIFGVLCLCIYSRMRDPSAFFLIQLPEPFLTLGAPLAGLLMGLVQSLFETKPDNWAFVVHRPVSRRGVFAAKCAAGLMLLYGALGLPCLLAAVWAAWPGKLPMAFQGRMVLPAMADVLNSGC